MILKLFMVPGRVPVLAAVKIKSIASLHVYAEITFKKEELTPDLVQLLSQSGAHSAASDPASSALQAPFYH